MNESLPFEVRRGAGDVPWIVADDEFAVAYGQGWVTAVDRGWQITNDRWHARAETSAHMGSSGTEWDRFANEIDLLGTARRAWDALDYTTQSWVNAYAEGATRGFSDLISGSAGRPLPSEFNLVGAGPPKRWEPIDSLAVFWLHQVLLGSWGHELWRRHVTSIARHEPIIAACQEILVGCPTRTAASNAVGIAADLTASGHPVVVADPHRILEIPGTYQQIGLICRSDSFDAIGLAFPGVPGIPHFGHNGRVAWAVTHAMALSEVPTETSSLTSAADIATRGSTPLGLGIDAMRSILHTRTVDEASDALRSWVTPVNAWLLADKTDLVEGVAGCRILSYENPDDEPRVEHIHRFSRVSTVAVHANDARPLTADLGNAAAPPYRAERLQDLVDQLLAEGRSAVTAHAVARLLTDTQLNPVALVPQLAKGPLDMAVDNPEARLYATRRDALARRLASNFFSTLAEMSPATAGLQTRYPNITRPWLDPADRLAHVLPRLAREHPRLVEKEVSKIIQEHSTHPIERTRRAAPIHALGATYLERIGAATQPTGGDAECVCSTTTSPSSNGTYYRGPAARVAWDLGSRDTGGWVVPFGAAGDLHDPHAFDQHKEWARGALLPVTTPAANQKES